MKKRRKSFLFGFLIIPFMKFILYILKSKNIKYGKIRVSIYHKDGWGENQQKAFNACFDLLKNTLPEENISKIYSNINRIYVSSSIDSSLDYWLTQYKMLMIFYKEGYTNNHRYLASLLVRCAYEMENFYLPKKERKKIGRIAQLDCLSNFSGEDIDFFKDKLLNLINDDSDTSKSEGLKDKE